MLFVLKVIPPGLIEEHILEHYEQYAEERCEARVHSQFLLQSLPEWIDSLNRCLLEDPFDFILILVSLLCFNVFLLLVSEFVSLYLARLNDSPHSSRVALPRASEQTSAREDQCLHAQAVRLLP